MHIQERKPNTIDLTLSLAQAKQIYWALFKQLRTGGAAAFDDFDDDDLLSTLQTFLQHKAREAGVDCTIHAEWERFLKQRTAPTSSQ